MATKPTDRILDWASGGSTVDPGAGKEAAGWLVSERPPASWWNWILNSFGQWLTYLVAKTDEAPVAYGRADSDGFGGATVTSNSFGVSGAAVSSTEIRVTLSTAQASTDYMVLSTFHSGAAGSPDVFVTVQAKTTTTFDLRFYDLSAGSIASAANTIHSCYFAVFGSG